MAKSKKVSTNEYRAGLFFATFASALAVIVEFEPLAHAILLYTVVALLAANLVNVDWKIKTKYGEWALGLVALLLCYMSFGFIRIFLTPDPMNDFGDYQLADTYFFTLYLVSALPAILLTAASKNKVIKGIGFASAAIIISSLLYGIAIDGELGLGILNIF